MHSGLAMTAVGLLGSEEQKARWLPPLAAVDKLGAFALTEPDHGSDVVRLATRARGAPGGGWTLHGAKRWIGNGTVADLVVVWARDDDGEVGAFVVEHPDGAADPVPGYHAQRIVGKAANRAVWQAQIELDDVHVPADARLAGRAHLRGHEHGTGQSRQTVAWEALGHAVAAYEGARHLRAAPRAVRPSAGPLPARAGQARAHARRHHRHADPVRAHVAAAGRGTGAAPPRCTGQARHRVGGAAGLREARDILGGNGILLDHHVARHHADIEAVYTYEGTDSIQSLIVGRAITGLSAFV